MGTTTLVTVLASIIGGGAAGAILTILYNWLSRKIDAAQKEKGITSSLAAEIWQCILLCDHNAQQKANKEFATYIRFPTTVAQHTTFEQRYSYPRLRDLQNDLEAYTLGVLHVNQLIDLHNSMLEGQAFWQSTAEAYLRKLTQEIGDFCSDGNELPVHNGPIKLKAFASGLRPKIEKLIR